MNLHWWSVFSTYGIHTTLQAIVDSRIGFVIMWVDFGPVLHYWRCRCWGFCVCFSAEEVMEALYAWNQGDLPGTIVVST